jgi:nucleotide-binding universal stress UspA family protein
MWGRPFDEESIMRILVAYDGSSPADAAVMEVGRRPWPARTQVRLVSVAEWPPMIEVPPPAGPEWGLERLREALLERTKRSLEDAQKSLASRPDLDVTSDLREGNARQSLLEAIEAWKPDLVMVGSTGKSGLKRFLMGSVCHALVTHAPCNVEVVRAPLIEGK